MPIVYILGLRLEDRVALQMIVDRGGNWRCRERARTLLLLDDGISAKNVASAVGLNSRTVQTTRSAWFREGLASLKDLPRIGAPKKITADQLTRIVEAATEPIHRN
jgi:transposase